MFIIILMNFFMALFRSPVIALMPDITPPKKRSQANGVINFMGGLGALLAYFAGKPLYDANNNYPFFAGAILLLISSILVVALIKEDKKYTVKMISENKNQNNTAKRGMQELMVNLKDVFASKEKSLLFMLLSILMWFIAFNALETFFTSYAQFHVGVAASTGTLILGVFSLTFMITAIPAGFLGSKIGRKKTIFIGITILIFIVISTYLFGNMEMNESNRDLFVKIMFVLFPIGGIGWALINVNSLPMIVDMTTNEKSGGYTGLYYFFSMAANIIAPPVAGLFVDVFSYSSLMIFTIVFFIFAGITMTRVKRGEVVKNES
jgi:MFS family permease